MSPAPTNTKVSCSSGAAVTAPVAGGIGFGDCAATGFSAKRTKPTAKPNSPNADLSRQTGRRSIRSLLSGPRLARERLRSRIVAANRRYPCDRSLFSPCERKAQSQKQTTIKIVGLNQSKYWVYSIVWDKLV